MAEKFSNFGLDVSVEEISTSGSAAATYISRNLPAVKSVYVVGETGLIEELILMGIRTHGGPSDSSLTARNSAEFLKLDVDESVEAVVCGLDREFTYAKLCKSLL